MHPTRENNSPGGRTEKEESPPGRKGAEHLLSARGDLPKRFQWCRLADRGHWRGKIPADAEGR
jgi:hypothetical protein